MCVQPEAAGEQLWEQVEYAADGFQGQDPTFLLQQHFPAAGGLRPTEQAELLAAIDHFFGRAAAESFRTQMSSQHPYERAMQVEQRTLLPGVLGAAAASGATRMHAFGDGFLEAAQSKLDADTLAAVRSSLFQGAAVGAAFQPIFLVGALHGAALEIGDLVALLADLPAVVRGLDAMVEALLSESGAEVAHTLGTELGDSLGSEIASLATMNAAEVAYWLGQKAGPLVAEVLVSLVLGALGIGAAVVAKRTLALIDQLALEPVEALRTLARALPESSPAAMTPEGVSVQMAEGSSSLGTGPRDPDLMERLYAGANRSSRSPTLEELSSRDSASLKQAELEQLHDLMEAGGMTPGLAGSATHKASRWARYQARDGSWTYEHWSQNYADNMVRAQRSHEATDAYFEVLGWGAREVTVKIDGQTRRLDIADKETLRAVEHKLGYVTADPEIVREIKLDQALVDEGWDIEWHIDGRASQPVRDLLAGPPPIPLNETKPEMPIKDVRTKY